MKLPWIVAMAGLACKVFAAEAAVRVGENDLPRVPATEATNAIATMQMRPGFRVERVASEPAVVSPVAMAFDENSRLFVVEMRDYSERREEHLGRVKRMEDRDGDGFFETANIFAENLPWPTAIICYDGGVFVGASPDILYLKDTDGDGRADRTRVVFSGFGNGASRLNVQQLLNSFTWGVDNRIHGALGGNPGSITNLARPGSQPIELRGRDFSFDPRTFDLRPESGGGQWGLSFDDAGNKFICSNSRHIAVEMYEDRFAGRNRFYSMPSPDADIAVDGPAAEVFRLSPDEPWRVLRTKWRVSGLVPGPIEGGGRASGYFTGAAAVTVYRGDAFPREFRGDAFVADCGSNLIHRKKIRRQGVRFIAERPADEQRTEFLASRDNWFRPVAMANAPDGALYIADMYREVVEHPWSLPPELKSRIDLNSGSDRGRLYRVVPTDFQRRAPVRLGDASNVELAGMLAHPNGWHRDTAARLLLERNDAQVVPLLRTALGRSTNHSGLHILNLLAQMGALRREDVSMAARAVEPAVRVEAAKRVWSNFSAPADAADSKEWRDLLEALSEDGDIRVRYQMALGDADPVRLVRRIERDVEDSWVRAAVLNGLREGAAAVISGLAGGRGFLERAGSEEFLREAARIAGAASSRETLAAAVREAAGSPSALALAGAFAAGLEQRGLSLASIDPKIEAQLTAKARAAATNVSLSDERRIEGIYLLAAGGAPESHRTLLELLRPTVSATLQNASVAALVRTSSTGASNVLAHWPQLSPDTRRRTFALLTGRRASALQVLRALEQGMVQRHELAATDVQRLTTHSDAAVRAEARRLLARPLSQRQQVIDAFRPSLELAGDARRGRVLFQQRCASCHRAGTEGFAVGPDLASVAGNGREKLLASILDPNAEVAATAVSYAVETRGGDSFVGVLAGDNPLAVLLRVPNGETMRVPRENILSMKASGQSLMPEGLEEGLDVQGMADLLEFIVRAPPGP